jgi:two-component system cell cycle response regulator
LPVIVTWERSHDNGSTNWLRLCCAGAQRDFVCAGLRFAAGLPKERDVTSALLAELDGLLAVVEGMELDRRTVDHARAEQAELLARAAGRPALAARARLIAADALCRQGELVAAAPIMYEVNRWAAEQDDRYLLARSHFQLAVLQTWLGDNADARHHALLSVDRLPDDAPPNIRGNHLIMLAVAVGTVSRADAAKYHAEALDIAAATGDNEMSRSTLNNMAYAAYQDGDTLAATDLVERMYRVVEHTDAEMRPSDIDTAARVAMLAGRYAEAERILLPLVDPATTGLDAEGNMLGEMLLTIAEAQRLRGAYDRAQASLDRCVACCDERGLAEVRARARREQGRLFAGQGRYREAYDQQCRYDEESATLRSAEREQQAHLAQLVFESREGRRDAERFRELALRDPLTGLYNRRFVDSQLPVLLDRAVATGRPLSVALIDVDFFKRINDTLSHEVGDVVLRTLAGVLCAATAESATVARFGGEEFVLVMPDLDAAEAARLGNRVRLAVQRYPWPDITGELPVTVSAGVATATAGDVLPAVLINRADERLYAAKRCGRNRVVGEAGVE